MYRNLSNLKTNYAPKLEDTFLSKTVDKGQNMYAMMRGLDAIDHKIDDLVQHKKQFVFGGDQHILESTFKALGIDSDKTIGKINRRKKLERELADPNSELSKKILHLSNDLEDKDKLRAQQQHNAERDGGDQEGKGHAHGSK